MQIKVLALTLLVVSLNAQSFLQARQEDKFVTDEYGNELYVEQDQIEPQIILAHNTPLFNLDDLQLNVQQVDQQSIDTSMGYEQEQDVSKETKITYEQDLEASGNCVILYSKCDFKGNSRSACSKADTAVQFDEPINSIYIPDGQVFTLYFEDDSHVAEAFTQSENCLQTPILLNLVPVDIAILDPNNSVDQYPEQAEVLPQEDIESAQDDNLKAPEVIAQDYNYGDEPQVQSENVAEVPAESPHFELDDGMDMPAPQIEVRQEIEVAPEVLPEIEQVDEGQQAEQVVSQYEQTQFQDQQVQDDVQQAEQQVQQQDQVEQQVEQQDQVEQVEQQDQVEQQVVQQDQVEQQDQVVQQDQDQQVVQQDEVQETQVQPEQLEQVEQQPDQIDQQMYPQDEAQPEIASNFDNQDYQYTEYNADQQVQVETVTQTQEQFDTQYVVDEGAQAVEQQ